MLLDLVQIGWKFIQENGAIVISVMAFTEWVKAFIKSQPWVKSWMFTAIAFVIAFLCILPSGIELVKAIDLPFIVKWVALGGAATGIFKISSDIASRVGR